MTSEYLIRKDIMTRTRLSRSTLLRMERDGRFPKPTGRIGKNDVWPPEMLDAWMAAKLGKKLER